MPTYCEPNLGSSCPAWCPRWIYQHLIHLNIIDWSFFIFGVALVFRNFEAPHHYHAEEETYYFFFGTGKLLIGDDIREVSAPAMVTIPSNTVHAMTPVSPFVILFYTFREGPFKAIDYTYLDKKMYEAPVDTTKTDDRSDDDDIHDDIEKQEPKELMI